MSEKIVLKPGTPDDDNRDYLPLSIIGSDIVVNENGNNSQPYPELLKEYKGEIVEGKEDVWYEYVPKSYDPSKKTPLVISMHGGMMTGWGQAIYTSWTYLADRDGFIVLLPNSSNGAFWQVEWDREKEKKLEPGLHKSPPNPDENHDNKLVLGLIELMKSKYNIDEGRIFMQGMSMGDMMTNQFARHFGNLLAGAGGSGAAVGKGLLFDEDGNIKRSRGGPVAIWQSRPERNGFPGDLENNKINKEFWLQMNECDPIPQISIKGENNFAFYKGKHADLVYLDIKNRDHGQSFDDAAMVWDYLYSGTRREPDGTIVHTESVMPRVGDKFAISVAKDCKKAWFNNEIVELSSPVIKWQKLKYHGLNGGEEVRGEYLCAPLSFIAKVFDAQYLPSEDTLSATLILKDGRELQFARGSIGCVIDNRIEAMLCEALHRNNELHISFEWFCLRMYDLHVSTCSDVVYATDHYAVLAENMAELIKDLLKE